MARAYLQDVDMKVAIISCSPFIDYVRAQTLRNGFSKCDDTEIIVIKNENKDFSRYLEVLRKLINTRFRDKPDVYVLTFRGYEILAAVLLIAGNKPVIFDEFINPIEWLIYEHHRVAPDSILAKLFIRFYRFLSRRCTLILADTKVHAEYSASLNNLSLEKYQVVPVGTDEDLFHPAKPTKRITNKSKFSVFYYGQLMTPLHGLSYVLEASVKLKKIDDIEFYIVGGDSDIKNDIQVAQNLGANIKYKDWIEYKKLPNEIWKSDLCLGGPFGATVQSQMVVTGKTCQFLASAKPTIIGQNKIKNIFYDEKNCLITKQGSGQSIANKILWAYKNKNHLSIIAKNGKRAYEENFSSKVIIAECQAILSKIY